MGVEAALLAQAEFSSSLDILESPSGYAAALFAGDGGWWNGIQRRLGNETSYALGSGIGGHGYRPPACVGAAILALAAT